MYHDTIKTEEATGTPALLGGFFKGVLAAIAITVCVFFVVACLLTYTGLSESVIPFVAVVMQAVGAFLAGTCTVKRIGKNALLFGALAGIAYCLLLWVAASLAGGSFYVGQHFFTMLIFSAVGGAVGGVVAVNVKRGKSNRRRR